MAASAARIARLAAITGPWHPYSGWAGSPASSLLTGPRPNVPSPRPSGWAASMPPRLSWAGPGPSCAKASPATAGMPTRNPEVVRQRPIAVAHRHARPAGRPRPGPGLRSARPWRPPRPRTVVGSAVPVDPARGAVRHLGRQRSGRAVQQESRPPANHPGVGDHPTGRAQPPAGGPAHQPCRAPLRRPSRPHQPVAATPGVADGRRPMLADRPVPGVLMGKR
jgi:hypothetical protein